MNAVNNSELSAFLQAGWHKTEIITAKNGDQTIYQGKCAGSSGDETLPIWCIKKITITTNADVQTIVEKFADGSMSFSYTWNDRANLTYKYL